MNITAVIVVYNQSCAQSITCRRLAEMDMPLQVIVFDNSTRNFGNRAYCDERGWVFLGGAGNQGLSKAYNGCIDYLKDQSYDGYICLFDDDTEVTADYFRALKKAIAQGGQLFVPLIYADGRLLSPCRITPAHKAILFPDEEAALGYTGKDMSAINSGMAMALSLFDDYRYDEHIFLDGIDHTHIRKLAERNIRPAILDVRFHHQFSGDEKPAVEGALFRFGLFARDYAYIFRDCKRHYWYLVGKRALRLCGQYKTLAFLKTLWKYASTEAL